MGHKNERVLAEAIDEAKLRPQAEVEPLRA
jgi:hypothetical protein